LYKVGDGRKKGQVNGTMKVMMEKLEVVGNGVDEEGAVGGS
jgi:hypothetical protein